MIGEPHACSFCSDTLRVLNGPREIPCPRCAGWSSEEREAQLRRAAVALAPRPGITEADLTDDEFRAFRELRLAHPKAHKLTVLAWLEGRRYDPSADPICVADTKRKLAAWRFTRLACEGPLPGWVESALRGEKVPNLEPCEEEFVENLRAQRRGSRRAA